MLESFIVDYFPKNMYRRRIPLAGSELGNGLEMWRILHIEHRGGNDAIEFGRIRRLQEFQKYNDLKMLGEHLDDWLDLEQLWARAGTLPQAPHIYGLGHHPEDLRGRTAHQA